MTSNIQTVEKISISKGNSKLGYIPSVSLPPVKTCAKNVPCVKDCYALALCNFRPTVRNAYERNLRILKENPDSYWLQVRAAASTQRYFRYHVAGDIPSRLYFLNMIETALLTPSCTFLVFTKQYDIVNDVLNQTTRPENLKIMFSEWGENWRVPNPHNLPTFGVLFGGDQPPLDAFLCCGNCTQCALHGVGCFNACPGDKIYVFEHGHGKKAHKHDL